VDRVALDTTFLIDLQKANDPWIACTARAARIPIVTRNEDHFERVPDLAVVGYAA
jgi:predicted nucleic acid-binding protein